MNKNEGVVVSAGQCPVCWGGGDLVVFATSRPATLESLVLWCPSCGCAWLQHPKGRVDVIQSIQEVAPQGVRPLAADETSVCPWPVAPPQMDYTSDIRELLASYEAASSD